MATVTDQMQHVLDRISPAMNDEAASNVACLAALRLLHDALLPRLNSGQRRMYDVLVRETSLTLIPLEKRKRGGNVE